MNLSGKKIILGISGSIAAYKSLFLLRLLQKDGAIVKVVITPSVSHFIGELSFSSLTHDSVFSDLWNETWSEHVNLGTWADIMVVAPTTANTLAKFAHGICDNALTAVYLAARCPVMVAPAMDADMYEHATVKRNLDILTRDEVFILPPGTGYLASGLEGAGRLMEPEEIHQQVLQFFKDKPLEGKTVLITAGPTQEAIDPVRYITNHSSGKMGYALAKEAMKLGAQVTLVSGPTALPAPKNVELIPVVSAKEMYEAVMSFFPTQDITIMSAAVSDYAPAKVNAEKIKKTGEILTLELKKTTDILKYIGNRKTQYQYLVGFALETNNEMEHAREKLLHKNLDLIVLNSLKDPGAGFGYDTNQITLIPKEGEPQSFPLKSKQEVAMDILQMVIKQMGVK